MMQSKLLFLMLTGLIVKSCVSGDFQRDPSNSYKDPQIVYSYRYGHIWPQDTEPYMIRKDIPVCIFDNVDNRDEVLKDLWNG